jgi:hypothetical protein
MFSMQAAYLFLLDKAKLAGSFEKGMFYRRLSFITEVLVITMIPLMLAPMVLATFRGELIFEGYCLIRGESFAVWFFAVGGSGLSMIMIYLFVKPLYTNAVRMKQQNEYASKKIMNVAKRNALIAAIAVSSTLISCTVYAGMTEVANGYGKLGEHLHLLGLVLTIPWDMLVMGICCRATTTIWLPTRLSKCMNKKSHNPSQDTSGNSDGKAVSSQSTLSRRLLTTNLHKVENQATSTSPSHVVGESTLGC